MIFDPTITLSHLITGGAIIVTLIGWAMRMQINQKSLAEKIDKIDADLHDLKELMRGFRD